MKFYEYKITISLDNSETNVEASITKKKNTLLASTINHKISYLLHVCLLF